MASTPRQAKLVANDDDRYDIAPYALSMNLLDRLISNTATDMETKPKMRTLDGERVLRAQSQPQ